MAYLESLDTVSHNNVLTYGELDTAYGLTSRFYGLKGEAAETIYQLGLCVQDDYLRSVAGIGVLINNMLEKEQLLPREKQAIQDVLYSLRSMSELVRGVGASMYSVRDEAAKYEEAEQIREFGSESEGTK